MQAGTQGQVDTSSTPHRAWRQLAPVLVASGGLGLVAASGTLSGSTEPAVTDGSVVFGAAAGALGAAALASTAWWLLRRTRFPIPIDLLTTIVVAAAIGALAGIADTQTPAGRTPNEAGAAVVDDQGEQGGGTARATSPDDRDDRIRFDGELGGTITLATGLVMLVAAAIFFGQRSELRERERSAVYLRSELTIDDPDAVPTEEFGDALRTSLASLRASGDPRRAIRAAYGALLGELAEIGLPRGRHEPPVGYIARCLSSMPLPEESITELLDLFQLARFSVHPITDEHARRAERALVRAIDHIEVVR